ncbi:hypothetical protein [Clostridium chrysemydis]|uniref:hypothetical protein n=1 Tax=Clostridium chrysemydis TaxID=2665504 RepID=UPI001884580B|nr:hypothetical protein [Clostridium chrysemydis]
MKKEDINLFDIFKSYSYSDVMELLGNLKDKEEKDFYAALVNFILQREQRKIIDK